MAGEPKQHVFVSYVRENAALVSKLCSALIDHGIDVWLDRTQLQPGTPWKQAIRRAIQNGAFFIACFSEESTSRTRTYMNEELTLAIEEMRLRPTDKTWFIPVSLSKCNIPDIDIGAGRRIADLHFLDLSSAWEKGIAQLVGAIKTPHSIEHSIQTPLEAAAALGPALKDYLSNISCTGSDTERSYHLFPQKPGVFVEPDVVSYSPNRSSGLGRPQQYELDVGELYGEGHDITFRRLSWTRVLDQLNQRQSRISVVIGPPGCGKSTVLQMTARQLANSALRTTSLAVENAQLPILLDLDTVVKHLPEEPDDIDEDHVAYAIRLSVRRRWHTTAPALVYLMAHLNNQRTWLLLDGLDEVRIGNRSDERLARLFSIIERWACHILVASRPFAIDGRLRILANEYRMACFSPEQVDKFIAGWFDGDAAATLRMKEWLRANPAVRRMGENPYLLTLLCWTTSHGAVTLIDRTRTQLYEHVVRHLFDRDLRKPMAHERSTQWLAVLSEIALDECMNNVSGTSLTSDLLRSRLLRSQYRPLPSDINMEALANLTAAEKTDLLLKELLSTRLVVFQMEDDGSQAVYRLAHRSILEFLAGRALAERLRGLTIESDQVDAQWEVLNRVSWLPRWHEVIVFAAGSLTSGSPRDRNALRRLFQILSDGTTDDSFAHRAALAGLCAAELPPTERSSISATLDHVARRLHSVVLKMAKAGSIPELVSNGFSSVGLIDTRFIPPDIRNEPGKRRDPVTYPVVLDTLLSSSDLGVRIAGTKILSKVGYEALRRHPGLFTSMWKALEKDEWLVADVLHLLGPLPFGIAMPPRTLLESIKASLRNERGPKSRLAAAKLLRSWGPGVFNVMPDVLVSLWNSIVGASDGGTIDSYEWQHEAEESFVALATQGVLDKSLVSELYRAVATGKGPAVSPAMTVLLRTTDDAGEVNRLLELTENLIRSQDFDALVAASKAINELPRAVLTPGLCTFR